MGVELTRTPQASPFAPRHELSQRLWMAVEVREASLSGRLVRDL